MNDTIGRSMRFSENCGVALHIMTREEYVAKYMETGALCPYCGEPVIKIEKEDKAETRDT